MVIRRLCVEGCGRENNTCDYFQSCWYFFLTQSEKRDVVNRLLSPGELHRWCLQIWENNGLCVWLLSRKPKRWELVILTVLTVGLKRGGDTGIGLISWSISEQKGNDFHEQDMGTLVRDPEHGWHLKQGNLSVG